MASVFKRGRVWYARYVDENGKQGNVAGFTDKGATLQLAAKKEKEAELIRAGLIEPPRLDRMISEELEEFRQSLEHKDVSAPQVKLTVGRCQAMIEGCRFVRTMDIDGGRVESWLSQQRKT